MSLERDFEAMLINKLRKSTDLNEPVQFLLGFALGLSERINELEKRLEQLERSPS